VADGGTLFLDEIADTSLAMQSKLLRALQEGEIRPLGAEEIRHVDIRILCASNKDLWQEVLAGRFREDLYYRLKVLELRLPSLRERREDIPDLAAHLLAAASTEHRLSDSALRVLQAYDWPGNVRELENELARASAMADSPCISAEHLSAQIVPSPQAAEAQQEDNLALKPQVEALERRLVEAAMAQTENNQSKAAHLLGLSRYGLQKKLQRYGIIGSRA
jgi:Nif-specific regulatory protein